MIARLMLPIRVRFSGWLLGLASLCGLARAEPAPPKAAHAPTHEPSSPRRPMKGDLESPQLRALRDQIAQGASPEAIGQSLQRAGTPIIEPLDPDHDLVTFIWRGDERTRAVSIDWPAWTFEFAKSALSPLAGSDVWWKSVRLPHDTRLSYRFVVAPPAARQAPAQRLELVLPGAPPEPYLKPVPAGAAGSLEQQVWSSPRLKNDHPLVVYRPQGYSADKPPYPLLILFDGESYLDAIAAPALLDNLIGAGKLPALVAVFVENATPRSRSRELPCDAAFADALASELVPFLRATLNVSRDPSRVAVAGASFGGLAAAYAAYRHPELFGLALSQSGSFWWNFRRGSRHADGTDAPGWLTRRFSEHTRLPIRFYLTAGAFERASGSGNLETTRALRDVLRAKGNRVDYAEFSGGHDHLAWRATLPDGLIALFGP
jgi:enterochelin esterase-like enzyme